MRFLPIVDRLGEIRRLYFATTRATIEDERSRATVFMHGLAQMRTDWTRAAPGKTKARRNPHPGRGPTKPTP